MGFSFSQFSHWTVWYEMSSPSAKRHRPLGSQRLLSLADRLVEPSCMGSGWLSTGAANWWLEAELRTTAGAGRIALLGGDAALLCRTCQFWITTGTFFSSRNHIPLESFYSSQDFLRNALGARHDGPETGLPVEVRIWCRWCWLSTE